jgi:hypothetical protein
MSVNRKPDTFRLWPPLIFGSGVVLVPTLLERVMSKPAAWGVGFFVWSVLFYAVENRFNVFHANFAKYLIAVAALSFVFFVLMR